VISGTVIDGESGDPVRKALVTLTLEGTPGRWATARTDGSGRFEFKGLPSGKYDLRATKMNEGTAIYGANLLRELGDVITLSDGETRGAITLRFLHSASISGHVYDSEGGPVANATVSLVRPGRNLGAPVRAPYGGAITDDRGEYRFPNVDPGRYYLRVTPSGPRWFGGPDAGRPMLADQFYRDARDSKDAAAVHVGTGKSLAGCDFHLVSGEAVEVRGQILGVPAEPEPLQTPSHSEERVQMTGRIGGFGGGVDDPVQVRMSPAEPGSQRWTIGVAAQGLEHRFKMASVPAGRYRVEADFQTGSKAYGASQIIDLHPGVGEILLTLAPAVDIHGRLRVERQAPRAEGLAASRPGSNSLRVQLVRPEPGQGNVSTAVGAHGRFTLDQVLPGEWELSVTPMPPGFLKWANFGDKDVRFTSFEAGSSSGIPLNIVVSMRTAIIQGEVVGDRRTPRAPEL
jgi:protocatechuate 3,4-dioxygenase beta subunit